MPNFVAGRRREVTAIELRGHQVSLTDSHFWTPLGPPLDPRGVYTVDPLRTLSRRVVRPPRSDRSQPKFRLPRIENAVPESSSLNAHRALLPWAVGIR